MYLNKLVHANEQWYFYERREAAYSVYSTAFWTRISRLFLKASQHFKMVPNEEVPNIQIQSIYSKTSDHHTKYTLDLSHSPQVMKPLKKYGVKINLYILIKDFF